MQCVQRFSDSTRKTTNNNIYLKLFMDSNAVRNQRHTRTQTIFPVMHVYVSKKLKPNKQRAHKRGIHFQSIDCQLNHKHC